MGDIPAEVALEAADRGGVAGGAMLMFEAEVEEVAGLAGVMDPGVPKYWRLKSAQDFGLYAGRVISTAGIQRR
jgi:hypothetical protein